MVKQLLDRSLGKKENIKFTMPVSGGLVTRKISFQHLAVRSNIISASSEQSRVVIDMSKVSHFDIDHQSHKKIGTLYNKVGTPQLIIETI